MISSTDKRRIRTFPTKMVCNVLIFRKIFTNKNMMTEHSLFCISPKMEGYTVFE